MTLRHLKIFVTVCELGTVTAAGEKLYIAQPSVSLAISELEAYYGVKLFDRISKRLYITETGRQFLHYATHVVALFDEMEQGIKDWDSIGTLRIGASITIGNYLMPKYVKAFEATHSKIKVQVIIDNSEKIEDYILNNKIDLGLIEGHVHSSYIQKEDFMKDRLVLICSRNHPFSSQKEIEVEDLKDEAFILREKGSAGREIFEGMMEASGIKVIPSWESVSTQAIVRAVSENLGISILPYLLVKDHLERHELISCDIAGYPLQRTFTLIYHKHKYLTQGTKDFIELCKTQME